MKGSLLIAWHINYIIFSALQVFFMFKYANVIHYMFPEKKIWTKMSILKIFSLLVWKRGHVNGCKIAHNLKTDQWMKKKDVFTCNVSITFLQPHSKTADGDL